MPHYSTLEVDNDEGTGWRTGVVASAVARRDAIVLMKRLRMDGYAIRVQRNREYCRPSGRVRGVRLLARKPGRSVWATILPATW